MSRLFQAMDCRTPFPQVKWLAIREGMRRQMIGLAGVPGIAGSVFVGLSYQQGQLDAFLQNGDIDTINTTTGQATFVSHSSITDGFGGVGIVSLVPEPAALTLGLVVTAVALLPGVGRRLKERWRNSAVAARS